MDNFCLGLPINCYIIVFSGQYIAGIIPMGVC